MNDDARRPFVVRLARAFLYAWRGIMVVSRDRMLRIQLLAAIVVVAMAAWLKVSRVEWAILMLTVGAVLALEAMNTAVEAVVDLAMPERHPLAARAKDAAAGAVLIAAIAASAVGLFILGPRLWAWLT